MSLLSVDITKVKKLSLREDKPQLQEEREVYPVGEEVLSVEPETETPLIDELVKSLGLVEDEATPPQVKEKPLKPAPPKSPLARLEDEFLTSPREKLSAPQRTEIIKLLDRYKRDYPSALQLQELEVLITGGLPTGYTSRDKQPGLF